MRLDELVELSDGLTDGLVSLPADAPDVCPACHTSKDLDDDLCFSCAQISATFGLSCPMVIPISYYRTPPESEPRSALRERMHDYKEHADPTVRKAEGRNVAAILSRYLVEQGAKLRVQVGNWDCLVAVPSTKADGWPALASALDEFANLIGRTSLLLRRGTGVIGRSSPNATAFDPTSDVTGLRVLLVDDTFTTGATLHSAARALMDHGAVVVAGLVVARKINPDARWAHSLQVWNRQAAIPFDFRARPFWSG